MNVSFEHFTIGGGIVYFTSFQLGIAHFSMSILWLRKSSLNFRNEACPLMPPSPDSFDIGLLNWTRHISRPTNVISTHDLSVRTSYIGGLNDFGDVDIPPDFVRVISVSPAVYRKFLKISLNAAAPSSEIAIKLHGIFFFFSATVSGAVIKFIAVTPL